MDKIYVTMTDKFMSGWGKAEGKINKLVFECETWHDAGIVADNAAFRSEMKYISIRTTKPYYNKNYFVSYHDNVDYPSWYIENYFK